MKDSGNALLVATMDTKGYDVVIFHTVGSGGKAMEEMLEEEKATALVDLSLHEIADLCNDAASPVKILIPMGGFSAFDAKRRPSS